MRAWTCKWIKKIYYSYFTKSNTCWLRNFKRRLRNFQGSETSILFRQPLWQNHPSLLTYTLCTLNCPLKWWKPLHGYVASSSGKTTGYFTSGSGEKPRVAPRVLSPVAVAICIAGLRRKETPLVNTSRTDLICEIVCKTNPSRSIYRKSGLLSLLVLMSLTKGRKI